MNNGRVQVYIDSAPEDIRADLALEAERVLEDRWNGYLRPLATAEALGAFLDSWRAHDPNGGWGYPTEIGDTLVCTTPDDDYPDEFPRAGETSDGMPLYDLTGWVWIAADHHGDTLG